MTISVLLSDGLGYFVKAGIKLEPISTLPLNGEYRVNWILMAVGLVLMIAPWIYYFRKRKNEDDRE